MTIYGGELLTIVMIIILVLVSTVLVIKECDHPRRWSLSPSCFSICSYRLSPEYKTVAAYGDAIFGHSHESLYARIGRSPKKKNMAVHGSGFSPPQYHPSLNARVGSRRHPRNRQSTEMELPTTILFCMLTSTSTVPE